MSTVTVIEVNAYKRGSHLMTLETISATTALAAVIISPIVSLILAKWQIRSAKDTVNKQIESSTISANRQHWINSLRDIVSELQGLIIQIQRSSFMTTKSSQIVDENWNRVFVLRQKLKLMINPNEKDHQDLIIIVDTLLSISQSSPTSDSRKEEAIMLDNITNLTQLILKREWQRVKSGN